jgi:hypothetical protein
MSHTGERTVTEGLLRTEAHEYYLFWRKHPGHPWHSFYFETRDGAYRRYFFLIERGIEAYLERRRPRPE